MAGLFNVFIERARSDAAGAAAQLANAIAVRYGIPAAEVERRLAIGRFRVKGNVDRETADTFAADLTRLGAIVTVAPIEADAPAKDAPAKAAPAKAAPAVSLAIPRVEPPKAPPPAPAAKPAAAPKAAPSPYTSGLAAAASAKDADDPGLGALSGDFPLTLSTLDGADDASSSGSRSASSQLPASFGPPAASPQLPASFGPPPDVSDDVDVPIDADEPAAPPSMSGPADMFAPPEAQAELQLALEVDAPPRKKRRTSAPPPVTGAPVAAPPAPANQAPAAALPTTHTRDAAWKDHARNPLVQYIAGIVLCAGLALIPAMIVGSIRERSAFAELDGKLQEREAQVLTRADWDNLDRVRASFAERKRAERQSIAFTSVLLWGAIAGALAYVWFRVIDWDRVLGD